MAARLRVAITQSELVYLDLKASIKKACRLVAEAAGNGAKLVAFPECWVPGYPAWIWARPVDTELQTRYIYNALPVESEAMDHVKATARENSMAVMLGFSERSPTDSFCISQAIISPAVRARRAFDGPDLLDHVASIDFGCPDHGGQVSPLLKYHTMAQGEAIHVAMWPPLASVPADRPGGLWRMTAEGCQNLSQTYAVESVAYVLHSSAVCSQQSIDLLRMEQGMACSELGGGHSCVIAPDGRHLTEPLDGDEAGAVMATRGFLDVIGHYTRPDLLWLGVDKWKREVVVRSDPSQ
ncbi:carbon-nitrogen hydrolase [Parathielavia appendiculata]|uniref:nitrilase n=1 Tax=Parathielavia appendiculata TaxID=2587402 RepID=A0AAN6TY60_9PEZI|nr:carbon-nitrogen hydrolase [Parathielavia appendiculata]